MKLSKGTLNIGISFTVLILFMIIIMVGWVYVTRTDEQVERINATINKVNASINNFQKNSNHRWNITFEAFDRVAGAINTVADRLADNQIKNLNLTKFNRAALLDSNIMIHKLWENITGINPCVDNPLSICVDINNATATATKNITQLVTNSSPSATDIYNDPKQSASPSD